MVEQLVLRKVMVDRVVMEMQMLNMEHQQVVEVVLVRLQMEIVAVVVVLVDIYWGKLVATQTKREVLVKQLEQNVVMMFGGELKKLVV